MSLSLRFLFLSFVLFVSMATQAHASELSEKLAAPDYVLLMRHARAPGVGNPQGFSLDDCKTQRNLNDEGREQARKVGLWLRQQGVTEAIIASSPWCRCQETARLLAYGAVQVDKTLASLFDTPQNEEASISNLQKRVAALLSEKSGRALIMVTHEMNILRWTGESIAAAEMVLVKVDRQGRLLSYKVYGRPD